MFGVSAELFIGSGMDLNVLTGIRFSFPAMSSVTKIFRFGDFKAT